MPESTRGKRAWRHAAAEIEHYRHTYQITEPDRALGPEPHSPGHPAHRQRARTAIERVQAKQRATDHSRDPSRPASGPSNRDLTSSAAGQAQSGPPASTSTVGCS